MQGYKKRFTRIRSPIWFFEKCGGGEGELTVSRRRGSHLAGKGGQFILIKVFLRRIYPSVVFEVPRLLRRDTCA